MFFFLCACATNKSTFTFLQHFLTDARASVRTGSYAPAIEGRREEGRAEDVYSLNLLCRGQKEEDSNDDDDDDNEEAKDNEGA